MVLSARGLALFPLAVAAMLPARPNGARADDLARAARDLGLVARGFRVSVAHFRSLPFPFIAHYTEGHYVVVEKPPHRGTITVVDPSGGRKRLAVAEFSGKFSGVVLCVERPRNDRLVRARMLIRQLRLLGYESGRRTPWQLGSVLLLAGGATFLPAIATRQFYAGLTTGTETVGTAGLVALFTAATALSVALLVLKERSVRHVHDRAQVAGVTRLGRLLGTISPYFLAYRSSHEVSGELMEAAATREPAMVAAVSAAGGALTVSAGLGLLWAFSPFYFVGTLGTGLVVFVTGVALARSQADEAHAELEAFRDFATQTGLTVEGLDDHRAIAAETWLLSRWDQVAASWTLRSSLRRRRNAAITAVQRAVSLLAPIALLALTYTEVGAGRLTLAVALGLNMIGVVVVGAFVPLANDLRSYLDLARTAVKWDVSPQSLPPAWSPRLPAGAPAASGAALSVRDLVCAHPGAGRLLISGLSFDAGASSLVAVVGKSGSGKTTLLRVLAGLTTPVSGSIAYDMAGAAAVTTAFAARDPVFPGGTVSEIVTAGWSADDAEIASLFAEVGAAELIDSLPDGLRSRLAPGGVGLSSGQRSRVALVRACLRRPAVLILDEPTAALDRTAADAVIGFLRRLPATVVVATHDEHLVAAAQHVLDLDHETVNPEPVLAAGIHQIGSTR